MLQKGFDIKNVLVLDFGQGLNFPSVHYLRLTKRQTEAQTLQYETQGFRVGTVSNSGLGSTVVYHEVLRRKGNIIATKLHQRLHPHDALHLYRVIFNDPVAINTREYHLCNSSIHPGIGP